MVADYLSYFLESIDEEGVIEGPKSTNKPWLIIYGNTYPLNVPPPS